MLTDVKDVIDSMNKETENMKNHVIYECVPYIGQKRISIKWVMSERYKDNKKIMKVHFVSHGYEEDSYNLKTDSSTCSCKAMRLVMLTASVIG